MRIKNKTTKKAQGLPLNTIVLAIIVILVLVSIIVFFTVRFSQTSNQLDSTSSGFTACSEDNNIVTQLGFKKVEICDEKAGSEACSTKEEEGETIAICNSQNGYSKVLGVTVGEGEICCGTKKAQT